MQTFCFFRKHYHKTSLLSIDLLWIRRITIRRNGTYYTTSECVILHFL
ncbi:hypothetical protein HMPREF3201_01882 [Megasphaera sp. MJR8396C]|nr:hypothetical protein HMPREF3201_01882 [Megasphaera sp. MJR8396C]